MCSERRLAIKPLTTHAADCSCNWRSHDNLQSCRRGFLFCAWWGIRRRKSDSQAYSRNKDARYLHQREYRHGVGGLALTRFFRRYCSCIYGRAFDISNGHPFLRRLLLFRYPVSLRPRCPCLPFYVSIALAHQKSEEIKVTAESFLSRARP